MIVRDEEEALPACLASITSVCEEIVVVDTGSRDATPRIARELGARVFDFEWIDDFSAARNYAAGQASQPFILRVDADERLAENSLAGLLAYCREEQRAAGRATLMNVLPDGETTSEYLTVLYPNVPEYRYERRIHEQLRLRGGPPPTVATELVIQHTGYSPEVIERRGKAVRNLRLLEIELSDRPTDAYLHYQVGRTRYAMKDYATAVACFDRALGLVDGPAEANFVPTLLLQQAYSYVYLRDLRSAVSTIATGVEMFPDFTDLYFVYGVALMQLGGAARVGEMLAAFEHCLRLGEADPARFSTVAGVGSFRAQHNLGAFREAVGDLEGARGYYAAAAEAGFGPALVRLRALAAV
jgi:glycosyltransferase involved in cell wall biosynthesis